ncbi:Kelch repeat protein [Pirellula staleyi DSM 6068]|uniref:Kelch repeat protein n=1 Tax=Pirellula staleyi (strain ATCC 27377 / DSM 6068 / ICPB 4128) TaxID=530564 RepID=D2R6W3_PIRSD|nr:DUF3386 family protein [Pirellula staleyi]ADB19166.1 Kelch repeat protein [Pirellula staleyi DSM 6068]
MILRNTLRLMLPLLLGVSLQAFADEAAPAKTDDGQTAQSMMDAAHHGRATWNNFTGFRAKIHAQSSGQSVHGTLAVAADGKLELKLENAGENQENVAWIERTLRSTINHRLSEDQGVTNVAFADNDTSHPMGRLVKSNDPAEKSLWRVQGDVLTEVIRNNEKTQMIISVSEVHRTADGKHLPHAYVVTTTEQASSEAAAPGAVLSVRQVTSQWTTVGHLDLPKQLTAVITKPGERRVVESITFSDHELLVSAKNEAASLPPLPTLVTSFGAAVSEGHLYVYGGQKGDGHKYSEDSQSNKLQRLSLAAGSKWEELPAGPRRTGVAAVAHQGKFYRIGGFEARNKDGDEWNLHSTTDFARFDPATGKWEELTPLPEGRSSHDAAVIGNELYVVGGWKLAGEGEGEWHDTAYKCDLTAAKIEWTPIAKPPFMRRALAVAAHGDKLYVLGGMDDSNEAVTTVNVYDLKADKWSDAPALPGKGFDGFGCSAFGTSAGLFAGTGTGQVFQLSSDGKEWKEVAKLAHPRFFHRMVAGENGQLVVVGGTSRQGKVAEVEWVNLPAAASAQASPSTVR